MKTIPVDIKHLEEAFCIDLHEFKSGERYPLSMLMKVLTPRLKGKTK